MRCPRFEGNNLTCARGQWPAFLRFEVYYPPISLGKRHHLRPRCLNTCLGGSSKMPPMNRLIGTAVLLFAATTAIAGDRTVYRCASPGLAEITPRARSTRACGSISRRRSGSTCNSISAIPTGFASIARRGSKVRSSFQGRQSVQENPEERSYAVWLASRAITKNSFSNRLSSSWFSRKSRELY